MNIHHSYDRCCIKEFQTQDLFKTFKDYLPYVMPAVTTQIIWTTNSKMFNQQKLQHLNPKKY
jgi:hypothetical protein